MKIKKALSSVLLATAFGGGLGLAGLAGATTLNTNFGGTGDGVLQNFIGIDWHSDGQAYIQGFDLTTANTIGNTDAFTLDYHGFAGNIFTTSGPLVNLNIPAPNGANAGTYELTLVAHLNETATCLTVGCNALTLQTDNGTFAVFIDYKPDAMVDPGVGTGYANTGSTEILGGTFTGGLASFFGVSPSPGGSGTGGGSLFATVNYSNPNYIDPTLLGAGSKTQTSLQLGPFQTADYVRSNCMEFSGAAGITGGPCTPIGPDTATSFMLQADASTSFQVPEPTTLALLGLGLFGMGAFSRKRNS
jgi:hypothetical protein